MNPPELNQHFDTLGLPPGASEREIRSRARRLFLQFHPDLNPADRAACEEKTRRIIEAYRALTEHISPAHGADTPPAPAPEQTDYLLFSLAHRRFGVPAALVREVVRAADARIQDLGLATGAFPHVAGVFTRGGATIALFNLHSLLGLKEPPIGSDLARRKIIVVDADESPAAFMPDEILGITAVRRADARPALPGDDIASAFLDGVADTGDGPAGLINLMKLIYNQALS